MGKESQTTIKEHLAAIREVMAYLLNYVDEDHVSFTYEWEALEKRIPTIEAELDSLCELIRAIQQDACRSVLSDLALSELQKEGQERGEY